MLEWKKGLHLKSVAAQEMQGLGSQRMNGS